MRSSDDKKLQISASGEMKRADSGEGFKASNQLRRVNSKDYQKKAHHGNMKKKEINMPGQTELHKKEEGATESVADDKMDASAEIGKDKKKGGCTIL